MWCIPRLTDEYIERMEHLLDLYARPYNPEEPVVCFDEKSKQLLSDTRVALPMREGKVKRSDYEYRRVGTRNIFCAVEPLAGKRCVVVTTRRTKKDFARYLQYVVALYTDALKIHLVCDNLNTHFPPSFFETFSKEEAERILSRIEFHYTPKHASWLNMAEIEIGVLSQQCIKGRIPTASTLRRKINAWQLARNREEKKIDWRFTTEKAREKFKYSATELN